MEQPAFTFTNIIGSYPLVLFYKGSYEDNPTFSIVDIVEKNLSLYHEKKLIRKLAYLVIEAVQNIEKYSQGHASSDDFCLVFSDHRTFHVITQNRIGNSDIPALKERLDLVNSRHADELNAIYKEALAAGERTSKGAGLGIIDMVRKSGNSLGYTFNRESEDFSSYRLHIRIPVSETAGNIQTEDANIALTDFLVDTFRDSKSALYYTGDFSNSFLQALLYMIKTHKFSGKPGADSIFHYTLIELTQNIKRHAEKVDGKVPAHLFITWLPAGIRISTLNLINSTLAPEFSGKLDALQKATLEELRRMNQECLSDMERQGGLGLIDISVLNHPSRIFHDLIKVPNLGEAISLTLDLPS